MIREYDPSKVSVIVNGEIVTGFDKSSMITVEYVNELWTFKDGNQKGEGARVKNPSQHATITLNLLQTSPSNSKLQRLISDDRENNSGTFAVLIKDGNGANAGRGSGGVCWIQKEPSLEYGAVDLVARAWVIESGDFIIEVNSGESDLS